jgi:putative hydrolase
MSKALSENLDKLMPEELSQMLGPAKSFISNAGASIFAMQLGQAVGKLSSQTLMGSEIGIPISGRPSLVAQNIANLISELPTPKSEVLIYLATRELALASLYASNKWLSEHIVTQVREFAAGLRVDVEQIQNLAESIDPSDQDSINQLMQAGSLVTHRTEEQEAALGRIELMLALIEGWADFVTELACKRLPSLSAISELFARHRATAGALEKTFETLLGLELQPKLRREAKAMWSSIDQALGAQKRDSLWLHPDQLPSEAEVTDPQQLIARLGSEGDDFDAQLRKLLDG